MYGRETGGLPCESCWGGVYERGVGTSIAVISIEMLYKGWLIMKYVQEAIACRMTAIFHKLTKKSQISNTMLNPIITPNHLTTHPRIKLINFTRRLIPVTC